MSLLINKTINKNLGSTLTLAVPNNVTGISLNITIPVGSTISFFKTYQLSGTPTAELQLYSTSLNLKVTSLTANDYVYGYLGGVKDLIIETTVGGSVDGTITGNYLTQGGFDFSYELQPNPSALPTDVNVSQYGGTTTTLGQKIMTASIPVTLASNQSTLPVSLSGNQAVNLTQVGGDAILLGQVGMIESLPVAIANDQTTLPVNVQNASLNVVNAGTFAVQDASAETSLTAINGKLPTALGQTTMANSLAVTLASNQSTLPVSLSGSQAVNLTQVGSSSISIGQGVMANSLPVVVASNQSSLPTTEARLPTALGQTTMANSLAVTLASNQSTLPVSLSGNQAVNLTQIGGTAIDVGTGVSTAGTQRVVLVNNSNVQTNTAQINGATPSMGSGVNGSGVQRMTIATDQGAITTQLPSTLGAKTTANSLSVCLASDASVQNMNISQYGGTSTTLGQKASTASIPIISANDSNSLGKFALQQNAIKTFSSYCSFAPTSATNFVLPVGFNATNLGTSTTVSAVNYYVFSSGADSGGNRQIALEGYNASGTWQTENIVLNNTTPVVSANTYVGFSKMYSKRSGTYIGNVFLTDDNSGATTRAYSSFPSGNGQLAGGVNLILIPNNLVCYITELHVSSIGASLTHTLVLGKNDNNLTTIQTGPFIPMAKWSIPPNSNSDLIRDGIRIACNSQPSTNYPLVFYVIGSGVDANAIVHVNFSYTFLTS